MSTLSGQSIDTTYQGLLKSSDNAALNPSGGALKTIEDGAGNSTPIQLNQAEGKILSNNFLVADATETHGLAITGTEAQAAGPWIYSGSHDFTGATVTGIGGGGGGITPLQMKSDKFITAAGAGTVGYHKIFGFTTSNYFQNSSFTMPTDQFQVEAIVLEAGTSIDTFTFIVRTAVASSTMSVALYDSYVDVNGWTQPSVPLLTLASGIDVSSTGVKTVTGLATTIPASSNNGVYFLGWYVDNPGATANIGLNGAAVSNGVSFLPTSVGAASYPRIGYSYTYLSGFPSYPTGSNHQANNTAFITYYK